MPAPLCGVPTPRGEAFDRDHDQLHHSQRGSGCRRKCDRGKKKLVCNYVAARSFGSGCYAVARFDLESSVFQRYASQPIACPIGFV